jgi:hypothetical protein
VPFWQFFNLAVLGSQVCREKKIQIAVPKYATFDAKKDALKSYRV